MRDRTLMQQDPVLVPHVTAVSAAAVDTAGGCDQRRVLTAALRAHFADLRKDIIGTQRLVHVALLGLFARPRIYPNYLLMANGLFAGI